MKKNHKKNMRKPIINSRTRYKLAYTQGWRYAFRLNKYLFKDILHDAFLHWYNKTGKDLFEEGNGTVCRVIKLTYYGYYIANNTRNRKFEDFEEQSVTTLTPEQQLIEAQTLEITEGRIKEINDYIEAHYPKTASNMIMAFSMKLEGYVRKEIAKALNVSRQTINYYMSNVRSVSLSLTLER